MPEHWVQTAFFFTSVAACRFECLCPKLGVFKDKWLFVFFNEKKIKKLIFDQLASVLSADGLPEAVLDTAWSC